MPLKMMTTYKKFIITSPISNYKIKKSVFMADFLTYPLSELCALYYLKIVSLNIEDGPRGILRAKLLIVV